MENPNYLLGHVIEIYVGLQKQNNSNFIKYLSSKL